MRHLTIGIPLAKIPVFVASLVAVSLLAGACSSSAGGEEAEIGSVDNVSTIVATTEIWADIVTNLTCGETEVTTLIPAGADPHAFEPSLADRSLLTDTDLLVANGLGLEEGLVDMVASAEADGTPVHYVADQATAIRSPNGSDPHIWFDPIRVGEAIPELVERLVTDGGLERETVESCAATYRDELIDLDEELAESAKSLPAENRKLITNHDALGYLADRYGFEVIGTVIPGVSGLAETNPARLEELADLIAENDVPAIFVEAHHAVDDADALARVADVEVVPLYIGSLDGSDADGGTYVELLRSTMTSIVDALA